MCNMHAKITLNDIIITTNNNNNDNNMNTYIAPLNEVKKMPNANNILYNVF